MWFLGKLFTFGLVLHLCSSKSERPNIIVIIADDMGFNDVGFHGSDEIPTPNIDALAYNGVILNSHYTQALCTPSRSAFLTGKYPIHLGMQHLVILEPEPWGLPLNETLLPQHLKRNGYVTHAIGKWHLGFFKKEYTPTYRGFDTHFGYWQGLQDYYDHTVHATYTPERGYDMRRNMTVDWESKGKYSTTLFTDEAVKLIHEHNTENPMFMYLAHLAPHTGNDNDPLQAPDEEIAKFSHIEDPERRIYAAMVSMLDKSVGSVITALREKRMLDNSVILFMSDNGAMPEGIHANHGSNYPLKGAKNSAWEGALRGVAAIWSPLLQHPQRVCNQLMHISDWLPTIYSAAGLNKTELPEMDGLDMWQTISKGVRGPRHELLHNIDDVDNYGAVRQGEWKYLYGSTSKGKRDVWYGDSGKRQIYSYDEKLVLESPVASAISGLITYQQIKEKNDNIEHHKHINFSINLLDVETVRKIRDSAQVKCRNVDQDNLPDNLRCDLLQSPCLFNVKDDPCEEVNLATERPVIVKNLEQVILKYRKTALSIRNVPRDINADPGKWNNTWVNWQDCEYVVKQKISFNSLSSLAIGLIAAACLAVLVVVFVLCSLSSKQSPKRSRPSSLIEEAFEEISSTMKPKMGNFADRELQVRSSFKDELRTVE